MKRKSPFQMHNKKKVYLRLRLANVFPMQMRAGARHTQNRNTHKEKQKIMSNGYLNCVRVKNCENGFVIHLAEMIWLKLC